MKSVQASSYGNPITYAPENRPDQAHGRRPAHHVDGGRLRQPRWASTSGSRWTIPSPPTTSTWSSPCTGRATAGSRAPRCASTAAVPSPSTLGAVVADARRARPWRSRRGRSPRCTITIDATNTGVEKSYDGQSGVGFAEVRVTGQQVHEVLRMPEDLLTAAGASSASHRLTIVMTRETAAPVPPATDPEVDIARTFTLPTARTFSVSGHGRALAVGPRRRPRPLARHHGAGDRGRLLLGAACPATSQDRTSATLDGNLATVWSPGLGPQAGNWLEYDLAHPHHLRPPVDGGGDRRPALGAHVGHRQRRRTEPHRGAAAARRREHSRGRRRPWR